eukprot:CAMPEP_0113560738 /NCGR_PEP_ID=MMETSP0015_2-20120614/19593_1 /TAXON_ID=2838 /ORGANISM="Odontella" /LENGTH=169 /DNA_ID=CAMNT_0000462467 /DNA_START=90 /DNA_END=599 /DNA_ORIENTATION=- /assembly_acc=CAM_ASM_000160
MALFEESGESNIFPTEPAFLVPVEVRDTPRYGVGHCGVFATEPIKAGTKFWVWTDRVVQIRREDLDDYLTSNFGDDTEAVAQFLRQGFVLPGDGKDEVFNSNPTDAGRFMNHCNDPNCGPNGTLRDVERGEELTMDYAFHGDPEWYRDICRRYGVLTEAEVARESTKLQ